MRAHLNTFLSTHDPPRHVRRALRGFVDCGVLAKGFVRVRCPDCREENLVAFSCKDRSFCPSCTARRAADTAARLVDEVLPHVPLRQWGLALPPALHLRVASDPELEGKLLRSFSEELEELLRATTRAGERGRGGNVTFLQHFGSALNLHLHFHILALDGVYAPEPTAESHHYRVLPFPGGRGAGEIIEVYPDATLRTMGLASYTSRPDEAVRLGIAACAATGIKLDVDLRLVALACRYSSGTTKTPDYDVADAFVALCTAILHAEKGCRPVLAPDPTWQERLVKEWEGAIWVPTITTSVPA